MLSKLDLSITKKAYHKSFSARQNINLIYKVPDLFLIRFF